MFKRGYKLIISVVLVATLLCGFCTSFASAELPIRSAMQRFNAWVASALVAGQITVGSTLAPVQSVLDTLSYGSGFSWTPSYSYQGATWDDDILNRSTIKIRPNSYTIDGVTYSDIIISSNATEKFRVNAFDVETAWNIASQSEGTYASGVGTYAGVPVFSTGVGTNVKSQLYILPWGSSSVGEFGFNSVLNYQGTISRIDGIYNGESKYYNYSNANARPTAFRISNRNADFGFLTGSTSISGSSFYISNDDVDLTPFDFDWVSGTVPAEQLPEGSMLYFRVPSEHTDSTHTDTNYSIPELVQNFPTYSQPDGYTYEFDPSLNPDFDVDLDASDALGNIISAIIAAYLAGLIDLPGTTIEYTQDEPEPPVPGATIADTEWSSLKTILDSIVDKLQSIIDGIQNVIQNLHNEIESLTDSIHDDFQDLIQTISELPESILEDIETGPSKVFRKALNILKSLFLPLLLPIKAMMGLWHYVVEWLASVNAPFVWIFGVMSGSSANLVLPIYAALAGSICIAIYKALGR